MGRSLGWAMLGAMLCASCARGASDELLRDGGALGMAVVDASRDIEQDAGTIEHDAAIPDAGERADAPVERDASMSAVDAGSDAGPPMCALGFADCNGRTSDGCEIDVLLDPAHCGACAHACPATLDAPRCERGTCVRTIELALEDATVDESTPDRALGGETTLLVDAWPARYEALLRPTSLDAIPTGAEVLEARLELTCFDEGDDVRVHALGATWSEASTRWSSRPARREPALASITPRVGRVRIDVTSAVRDWISRGTAEGLALVPSGQNGSDYRSREHGVAGERPRLVVVHR
ncbi:DNRLRE domain-containing protein [Sandaracinus amylolyticus]|uniref:DNRLRE domain-containing protein n=1 Tax=Sandaracinus amylolyticus TaxID=927083 RepID=UPI001F18B02E|nr:DNRLRE domain-containing protein [Sandaracinus amylolyticus]UJR82081.1 Hypothetical protein I5071_41460 [Sandaracinus amylolyticus]